MNNSFLNQIRPNKKITRVYQILPYLFAHERYFDSPKLAFTIERFHTVTGLHRVKVSRPFEFGVVFTIRPRDSFPTKRLLVGVASFFKNSPTKLRTCDWLLVAE